MRDIYEKKSIDSFATSRGKQGYSTATYYDETMNTFDAADLPVPSWEYYAAAEAEPIPSYRVEPASSGRSQCVQKGSACKHGAEKPHPDAFIAKGSTRVGYFDKEGGSYTRWSHLGCFRVPAKVWKGLPDPETCTDTSQFAKAIRSMNEVLLVGFSELGLEARHEFVLYVMNKENWAKDRKSAKTVEEQLQDVEARLRELEAAMDALSEGKATDKAMKEQAKAKALKASLLKKKAEADEKQKLAREQIGTEIPVFSGGFGSANAQSSSETVTKYVAKERFIMPVPGEDGDANVLRGKTCVMTGVFPEVGGGAGLNLGKARIKAMIESFGGKVTSSISGKTDILVVGKSPGLSKVTQARSKSSVVMMSLLDIANGIKVGLIEAPAQPLKIDSFSSGYTFKSGQSNGLALTATQKQLEAAAGYAPQAVKSEAESSSSSCSAKLSSPKKIKPAKAERVVKAKAEKVVRVKAEKAVEAKAERVVKAKAEKVVRVKAEKGNKVTAAAIKAALAPAVSSKAAQSKVQRAQKAALAREQKEEEEEAESCSMGVLRAGTGSGRSARQSSRRAAAEATRMLTN